MCICIIIERSKPQDDFTVTAIMSCMYACVYTVEDELTIESLFAAVYEAELNSRRAE